MNRLYQIFIFFFFINSLLAIENKKTYINTKNIEYDQKNDVVILGKNSFLNFKDINIEVDSGIIDYKKNSIEVKGKFYIYRNENILKGINLKGDTELVFFEANKINYIYNNEVKIDAIKVQKEDDIFYFYENFLTPCKIDGYFNCPTWSLKIKKTIYKESEDKFIHYNTFLQIADYKLFYIPVFSHYGAKADRKIGFLTPKLEFNLSGDNTYLDLPFYIPFNVSTDLLIKPKFSINTFNQIYNDFKLSSVLDNKSSFGNTSLNLENKYSKDKKEIYSTLRIKSAYTLNKFNNIQFNGVLTNSESNTRSSNDDPIKYEDIFLKLNSYDVFRNSDYLKSEISTVQSFETIDTTYIPLSPSIFYLNNFNLKNKSSIFNELSFRILKRDNSNYNTPSESKILYLSNQINKNHSYKNINFYNQIKLDNSFYDYIFLHNENLNSQAQRSQLYLSTDIYSKITNNTDTRLKLITSDQITKKNTVMNEDSNSYIFSYQNLFSTNRMSGFDLNDNSNRVVYGIESNDNLFSLPFIINLGQSYDENINSNYLDQINQNTKLSDIALEIKTKFNKIDLNLDLRLDKDSLTKKELNYYASLKYPLEVFFNYNETDINAFKNQTSDSKSLKIGIKKEINKNMNFVATSNLDLKNKYSPYTQKFMLNIFDDCSKLEITYSDSRYNDNFNTKPSQTISLSYYMDYLGFIGYEQSTNLFFNKMGTFNSNL